MMSDLRPLVFNDRIFPPIAVLLAMATIVLAAIVITWD
jgi:hypothetical protein